MRVGCQRQAPVVLPREGDPVPIVQEAVWNAGTVWTGEKNVTTTGIRSPDRPARSESASEIIPEIIKTDWVPPLLFGCYGIL